MIPLPAGKILRLFFPVHLLSDKGLESDTYSCAPSDCQRHPPSRIKSDSLETEEGDVGCRQSKARRKRSRKGEQNKARVRSYCPLSIHPVVKHQGGRKTV